MAEKPGRNGTQHPVIDLLFVEHYLRHGNKAKAAEYAYSQTGRPPPKRSQRGIGWYEVGYKLGKKPSIQAEIKRRLDELAEQERVETARVQAELMRVAFADLRRLFDDKGKLLDPKDWPEDVAAAVAAFDVFEEFAGRGGERDLVGYTKRVRAWPKVDALEKLARIMGMFKRDNEQQDKRPILVFASSVPRTLPAEQSPGAEVTPGTTTEG